MPFLKILRARRPGEKLYPILDGFSPRKHLDVVSWAAGNDIELVFLPTYSSWPNRIESEFAALRYFAPSGTDHCSHTEQGEAIAACVRWRNACAQPKRDFAPDSTTRTWAGYMIIVV